MGGMDVKTISKSVVGFSVLFLCGMMGAVMLGHVRMHVRRSFNFNRIAVIQGAIARHMHEKEAGESLNDFIARKWPAIEIVSGKIVDYNGVQVRYVIEDCSEGTFVGVYSAGNDRVWGTSDDLKREGTFLKEAAEGEQQGRSQ